MSRLRRSFKNTATSTSAPSCEIRANYFGEHRKKKKTKLHAGVLHIVGLLLLLPIWLLPIWLLPIRLLLSWVRLLGLVLRAN